MAVFIPKFLLKDLSLLHSKFGNEDFIFPDAEKLLKHDVRYSNQILSKLGKSGTSLSEGIPPMAENGSTR